MKVSVVTDKTDVEIAQTIVETTVVSENITVEIVENVIQVDIKPTIVNVEINTPIINVLLSQDVINVDLGPSGVPGIKGNTILYGSSVPTTEGTDGDFYIRTATNYIYGPKADGVWPAGVSLVGPPANEPSTSTITYDGSNRITNVSYTSGLEKDITYNGDGTINTLVITNPDASVVTKTMQWSGGLLTGVTVT